MGTDSHTANEPTLQDRLRDKDAIVISGLFHCAPVMREAADRIDQLERERAEVRAALAGEDFASLPSDFTTVRMAHTIRSERDKFLWQVRDTCARAEKAESARKDAPRD